MIKNGPRRLPPDPAGRRPSAHGSLHLLDAAPGHLPRRPRRRDRQCRLAHGSICTGRPGRTCSGRRARATPWSCPTCGSASPPTSSRGRRSASGSTRSETAARTPGNVDRQQACGGLAGRQAPLVRGFANQRRHPKEPRRGATEFVPRAPSGHGYVSPGYAAVAGRARSSPRRRLDAHEREPVVLVCGRRRRCARRRRRAPGRSSRARRREWCAGGERAPAARRTGRCAEARTLQARRARPRSCGFPCTGELARGRSAGRAGPRPSWARSGRARGSREGARRRRLCRSAEGAPGGTRRVAPGGRCPHRRRGASTGTALRTRASEPRATATAALRRPPARRWRASGMSSAGPMTPAST